MQQDQYSTKQGKTQWFSSALWKFSFWILGTARLLRFSGGFLDFSGQQGPIDQSMIINDGPASGGVGGDADEFAAVVPCGGTDRAGAGLIDKAGFAAVDIEIAVREAVFNAAQKEVGEENPVWMFVCGGGPVCPRA